MDKENFIEHIRQVWKEAECLFDETAVERAILNIAQQLIDDYAVKNPVFLCLMKGAVVFTGRLLTKLPFPLEIDYIHASRYGDEIAGATLQWTYKPAVEPLKGRHVVLLDDIFDQGATLAACANWLQSAGVASVEAAVLLKKNHNRVLTDFRPKYCGLTVPDAFVVGLGMDYKNYFRNANGIFKIEP